ncbi:MAG: VCBS repeat-containing protein, partial [Thermoguttaceae bacterium]|nr:VCBS repeat-containing protein [Thermoguttaceae bacterium]
APEDPLAGEWIFHPEFNLESASVPILVCDVNGDDLADLIYGAAHGYGIFWLEQKATDGGREWDLHEIDLDNSQYHELLLADLDGNGAPELISGKRYYAHCGHDPGAEDPLHLRFWHFNRGRFDRHTIDYGPKTTASGLGISTAVADVNGDGKPDLLAPGKEGLYLFINESQAR